MGKKVKQARCSIKVLNSELAHLYNMMYRNYRY